MTTTIISPNPIREKEYLDKDGRVIKREVQGQEVPVIKKEEEEEK